MKKLLTFLVFAVWLAFAGNVWAQDNPLTCNDQIVGKRVSFSYMYLYFGDAKYDLVNFMDESGNLVSVNNDEVQSLYPELFDSTTVFTIGDFYVLGDTTSVKEGHITKSNYWSVSYLPFTTANRTYYMFCEKTEGNGDEESKTNREEKNRKFLIFSSSKSRFSTSNTSFTKSISEKIAYYSCAKFVDE